MNRKPSRVGQWTGRRRSSRSDDLMLPFLFRRAVLVRLALVLATVLGCTFLVLNWGPALPYRVGEIFPRELRSRIYFEVTDQAQTARAREEAVERLPAQDRRDPIICEEVRSTTPAVMEKYPQGAPLVQRGQPVTVQQLLLLREENRAYEGSLEPGEHLRRGLALFVILGLLALLIVVYVARFQSSLAQSLPHILVLCVLVLLTITLGLVLNQPPWHALLVPLTVVALVLTIVYNTQFALLMSFSLSLAAAMAMGLNLDQLLVQTGGLATAVLLLRNVRTRTRLVEVGAAAGLGYAIMTLATESVSGQSWHFIAMDCGRGFLWGTLSGFLVSGLLPLVERGFHVITDIRLRELADGSHPLLQELVCRAPGTYTHSMTVATLAEAAAETIGANPLLARVGSYFHDIGKMLKPQYFIENQMGENRHDELAPALSTLIIMGHVKDGVALAEQYRLPRPIIDFIQQHHGTTLVEYFYQEALRLQEAHGYGPAELEASFRYAGPKPRSREAGVVMLADSVESTSRTLADPTPGSLRKLVHDMLMKRLLDGQFDESGLTLTELHRVEESLVKSLTALFHARIKYPEKERPLAS